MIETVHAQDSNVGEELTAESIMQDFAKGGQHADALLTFLRATRLNRLFARKTAYRGAESDSE
jgi:hypothetical protein